MLCCIYPVSLTLVLWLFAACFASAQDSESLRQRGRKLYQQSCADCHGEAGQGVSGAYDMALVGDDSIGQLEHVIAETMPEGSPEDCVAEDARAVAEYIHYAFYSEAAQIRNRPPQIAFSRLTASQLRQSVSDLYARFAGLADVPKEFGVRGEYYADGRSRKENRKIERIDPVLNFDFGRASPGEGIEAEEFAISWRGGLVVEHSGRYEIVVRSTCSFVMDFGQSEREFINNHVQSGDKTEFRRVLQLTGGRIYPFEIDLRQRKRKTEQPPASFSLSWVEPGGVECIVPQRNLVPDWVPPVFGIQTDLPPDDSSYGYARGIAVSREFEDATTQVALEFAQVAYEELWPQYRRQRRNDKLDDSQLLRDFLETVVTTAFRGPLTEEQKQRFIAKQLEQSADDAEAIKRVALIALKSPHFLYPMLDDGRSKSQLVANRLALILFDSLPVDNWLRQAVEKNEFVTEGAIRAYAEHHVNDYRARAKMREFLLSWLNVRHFGEIVKDSERFAGFDEALVSDMQESLHVFLDDVVWSEDSDYRRLFKSDYTFTTPRLAEHFGGRMQLEQQPSKPAVIGAKTTNSLVRTVASEHHLGLLSHPYLMSGLAYHDSTSPIHRGVFLFRYLLGRELRPPAEAFSPLSPDLHPDLTTRERVALQTSPESCQVCHAKINQLGYVLENFDAIGAFRTEERHKPIDASGSYVARDGSSVAFEGPAQLADYLANSPDAHRAFVARAFQHFVKQPPAAFGADTLDRLVERFAEHNYNIRQLIVDITVTASSMPLDSNPTQLSLKAPTEN